MIVGVTSKFILLFIYLIAAGYLLFRVRQVFSEESHWYKSMFGFSLLMSLIFCMVIFLRVLALGSWFLPFQTTAYIWAIFVLYAFMLLLLFDLLRGVVYLIKPLYRVLQPHMLSIRKWFFLLDALFAVGTIVYGLYHFRQPEVTELTIEVDKPVPEWTIVAVGDLHLGTMSVDMLKHHVDTINAMHPDVVLLLGDQFEINWREVVPQGYAAVFRQLRASKGVYAIHGNHEDYHGISHNEDPRIDRLFEYMRINLLDDKVAVVDGKLALVGREDSSTRVPRVPLSQLMQEVPDGMPVILLDHRPDYLSQAQDCGIDLQLSAHTHDGQIFPMNWVQRLSGRMQGKLTHGYAQYGSTQYYVTSGLGGSGAPIRIGTRSEIVVIHLTQKKQ